jgi:hypothetical protein
MVLKLRPLTCVGLKSKVQLFCTHIKAYDIIGLCLLRYLESLGFKSCSGEWVGDYICLGLYKPIQA